MKVVYGSKHILLLIVAINFCKSKPIHSNEIESNELLCSLIQIKNKIKLIFTLNSNCEV